MLDLKKEKRTVRVLSIIYLVLYVTFGVLASICTRMFFGSGNIAILNSLDSRILFVAVSTAIILVIFLPFTAIIYKKAKITGMKAIRIISNIFLIFLSIYSAQCLIIIVVALLLK